MVQKRIMIMLFVSMVFAAVVFISFQMMIWQPKLEAAVLDVAKKDTRKIVDSIDESLEYLYVIARDYAIWDDTYNYVKEGDSGYIANNLNDESLTRLGFDLVLIRDTRGMIHYLNRSDYGKWSNVLIPQELLELGGENKGYYQWEDSTYLIGTASIFPSDGSGDSAGVLLFGKKIDAQFSEKIEKSYGIRAQYLRNDQEETSIIGSLEKMEIVNENHEVYLYDQENLLNRYRISDLFGQPIGYIHIYSSRSIADYSFQILRSTISSLFVISLFVSLFLWNFLRKLISRPISELALEMDEFGKVDLKTSIAMLSEDIERDQLCLRRDEIGRLANSYHQMKLHIIEKQKEIIRLNDNLDQLVRIRTKALQESNEKLLLSDQVLTSTGEGVIIMDPNFKVLRVNQAFLKMSQFNEEDMIGKIPSFFKAFDSNEHSKSIWSTLSKNDTWSGEIWDRKKDGMAFPQWLTINIIRNARHKISFYVCLIVDISSMKENEQKLQRLAYYDPLTQLPNRALFQEHLQQAIYRASRKKTSVAVIFVDLDRFKYINDSLGHDVGDKVLQSVAKVILGAIRESDTVARFGGDEFTIILEDLKTTKQVIEVVNRILKMLNQPIICTPSNRELIIGASLGISMYPKDDKNIDNLIRKADAAMYQAKESGRNQYCFASSRIEMQNQAYLELETSLHQAIAKEEFELYLQPKLKRKGNGLYVEGAEALIRWIKNDGTIVLPNSFIPFAEEVGLINKITEWVIKEIARIQVDLIKEGIRLVIGINISAGTIASKHFLPSFQETLEMYGLNPSQFQIEITEEVIMKDVEAGRKRLIEVQELGIAIAMDDFGTGFSSLSRLSELPLDELKIDKSFVWKIGKEGEVELVSSIISMAKALKLRTVAEGVETEEQYRFLVESGCDEFQGYLFSRPLPYSDFIKFYRETNNTLTRGGHDNESILYRIYPSH